MASLPIFFHPRLAEIPAAATFELEEDTARHVVQVLRMEPGEQLELTDGAGTAIQATIVQTGKKKCMVQAGNIERREERKPALHLAVAFTKNAGRNEWLLEKATEMGVSSIIPLLADRSEREKFRYDRWQHILVSAMLQSRQYYLPLLSEARDLEKVLRDHSEVQGKYLAHCMPGFPRTAIDKVLKKGEDALLLIGPEGDFTPEEVTLAYAAGCTGITLGTTRLRTETAAMAACAVFNLRNDD